VKVLHKILGHLYWDWLEAWTIAAKKDIIKIAMVLVTGFGLGL
jgi:hypothetical protein